MSKLNSVAAYVCVTPQKLQAFQNNFYINDVKIYIYIRWHNVETVSVCIALRCWRCCLSQNASERTEYSKAYKNSDMESFTLK